MKRWLVMIVAVVLLVLVIGGVKGCGVYKMIQGFKAQGVPKQTVSTIKAGYQDWESTLSAIGTLRAVRGTDVSAEVAGIVEAIAFESGDEVKAGQILLRLRSADEAAQLASLRANAELAETTYKRDQQQLAAQAISQAALDTDSAQLKSAQAQVKQQQALLDKKSVRAPFAGRLGIRAVDLGEYVKEGTKLVTLQTLDPIYIDFNLPQAALAQIGLKQTVSVSGDSFAGLSFGGEITAIDPKIDTDTRNVAVRATLKNPDKKLLPGMFASVAATIGAPQHFITLPQTAVSFNPYGQTVYVIGKAEPPPPAADAKAAPPPPAAPAEPQLAAKQVFVTVGPTRGDQIAILKGVNEGDEIVTSGQLKLKNGALVTINNDVQPSNDANPQPQEQ